MIVAFLSAAGLILFLILVYVAGLTLFRSRFGNRRPVLYHAVWQCLLAGIVDLLVIYFSISFCTSSIKDGLRLRGSAAPNMLLSELTETFGIEDLDLATVWGIIIPIMSWLSAHGVVLGALLTARFGFATLTAHLALTGEEGRGELVGRVQQHWSRLAGAAAGLGISIWFFRKVIRFDTFLIQYQMISSSKALKGMLGADWRSLSTQGLKQVLSGSFIGEIVIHAGEFYVVALMIAAVLMVISLHNLREGAVALPTARYRPVPPPLPIDLRPEFGAVQPPAPPPNAPDGPGHPFPPGPAPGSVNLPPVGPPPGPGGPDILDLPPSE